MSEDALTILVRLFKVAEKRDGIKIVDLNKFNTECERMNIQHTHFISSKLFKSR